MLRCWLREKVTESQTLSEASVRAETRGGGMGRVASDGAGRERTNWKEARDVVTAPAAT